MSKLDYPLTFHPSLPVGEEVNVSEIPIDTGLIQCICELTEDDGFTIQCDRCLTWQHAYCMNINQNNIPDRYLCDNCVKLISSTTPSTSAHTLSNGGKDTQRSASKLVNSGSTDLELENNNKPSPTKRKEEKLKPNGSTQSFSNKPNAHSKRSRDLLSLDDYSSASSNGRDSSTNPSSTGKATTTVKKPKLSKRISVPKRSLQRNMMMMVDSEQDLMTKATTKLHATTKKDKYQPTNLNTVKSKFVYEVIEETRDRWKQSSKWKSQPWRPMASGSTTTTTTQHHSNKKLHYGPFTVMDTISLQQSSSTNIAIRSLPKQQHHHHHRSSYKLRKAAFADTPLHANTFLLEAHGEMVLKSEYKFDATNNYSLLGTSCAHVLFYPTIDLCIDGRRLGNDTRHFRRSCHPNAELRTMIFSPQKKRQRSTTHTPLGDDDSDDNEDDDWQKQDSLIRLGIFTRAPIEQGEEITLGWNWQKGHISWRKNVEWYRSSSSEHEHHQNRTLAHVKSDPMVEDTTLSGDVDPIGNDGGSGSNILHDDTGGDEETDRHTQRAIQQMLERFDAEFGDCACSEHDVCLIERLRQECDMLSASPVLLNGRVESTIPTTTTTTKSSAIVKTSHAASLQHSRQIIVAPSTTSTSVGSKSDNEKMVAGHSPAAGSVEENVDIDVISMSPGTAAAPSPANHTHVLDQVKKESNSDVDDELDIDGDIDIGDDEIPALSKTPVVADENKTSSVDNGGQPSYMSSLSSTSSLSGTDSDANGDTTTGKKRKGRRILKMPKQDSDTPSSTMTTPIAVNKPAALPCKKVWMRHFLQHNVKTENVTERTDSDSSDMNKQKSPSVNANGNEMDNQTATHNISSVESSTNKMGVASSTEDAMDMDLDEGELSDASSASTIPLDEDDRDWTLRTREQPSQQPAPGQPSIDQHNAAAISTQQPTVDEPATAMTEDATLERETPPLEEGSTTEKTTSSPTKPSSSTEEEVSQQQQQLPNETTLTGTNDDGKELDQTKPTKVKVSLQEYLSRRMASKDPPKSTTPNHHCNNPTSSETKQIDTLGESHLDE
ncbi:unnamed protein product [Absidia cylindrospora]